MAPKRSRPTDTGNQSRINRIKIRNQRRLSFSTRGYVSGRQVDLRNLERFGTQEAFEAVGWESLLKLSGMVQVNHVREFYSGFDFNESTDTISLQMYKNFYSFTLSEFGEILKVPSHDTNRVYTTSSSLNTLSNIIDRTSLLRPIVCEEIDPDTITKVIDQDLAERTKFWNKIVINNIFPRAGETEKLTALQAYLLYCLVKHIKIDLIFIIVKRMENLEISSRLLPHALLLNRLFKHMGLNDDVIASPSIPINYATLHRMMQAKRRAELRGSGGLVAAQEEPLAVVPYSEPFVYSCYDERFGRVELALKEIKDELRVVREEQRLIRDEQRAFFEEQNAMIKCFFEEFRRNNSFPPSS